MSHCSLIAAIAIGCSTAAATAAEMPQGFVYLRDVDPSIQQDMRYAGSENFLGHKVPGYDAAECVLTSQAANGLKAVETELKAKQLGIKVYDCYRPARAVASFVDSAEEPEDPKAKSIYYPALEKRALFPGYIATRSGHSRGSTMDLTLVPLDVRRPPRQPRNRALQRAPRQDKSGSRIIASTWARASIASIPRLTQPRQA